MNILPQIARLFFHLACTVRTDKEVAEFYQEIDSPWKLMMKLSKMGYMWRGENSFFDWNKTPNESLAEEEEGINCGDFMELYIHAYKLLDIKYNAWLLETSTYWTPWYDWHYITTFEYNNNVWLQSNNVLISLGGDDIQSRFEVNYTKLTEISGNSELSGNFKKI